MRTFTNQKTITQVKRLAYSAGKGTTSVVYQNLTCYLRPLTEEQAAISGMQWGQGFNILTETDSPMQVGDILTIDSETYTVRGLAKHDRGRGTAYYKYLAVKGQK